ncbi:hypothetical protein D3C78_1427140 [compost metagenome]
MLQRQIERQVNVFARLWRLFFQQAYHAAVVIHLHFLIAGGAVQFRLVISLNALLADIVVGGIVLTQTGFIQPLQVTIVDFRYVAHHMSQFGTVRIFPLLVGIDGYPIKAVLIDRKARHLGLGQPAFQRHRLVATVMVHIIAKGGDIFRGQIDNRRQRLQ